MRTFDASTHNVIANHPEVRPTLGGDGKSLMDFRPAIQFRDVYWFLINDEGDGATLFEQHAPNTFEFHTMFLPSCRGKRAMKAGRDMLHEMFTEHGAEVIWGGAPVSNRAARMFNRYCGGISHGIRLTPDNGEVEIFSNRRDTWLEWHSAR